MAVSEAQYKNRVKVIAVGAISKEFKRSAIIKKIVARIKSQGLVATGELSNPQATASILPTRDDRFLIAKDSVVVKTAKIGPNKTPIATEIRVKITYGLNEEKYFYLTEGSPNKKWFPNVGKIESWIRIKKQRGLGFTELDKEWKIRSTAFLIARSISKKGIEKRDFLRPFDDKRTGVKASLARAEQKVTERLFDLYGTTLTDIQNDVMEIIL